HRASPSPRNEGHAFLEQDAIALLSSGLEDLQGVGFEPTQGKAPRELFALSTVDAASSDASTCEAAPDGNRFLVRATPQQGSPPLTVIVNWPVLAYVTGLISQELQVMRGRVFRPRPVPPVGCEAPEIPLLTAPRATCPDQFGRSW